MRSYNQYRKTDSKFFNIVYSKISPTIFRYFTMKITLEAKFY